MSAFRRSKNSKRSTESIYDMLQMVSQVCLCVCIFDCRYQRSVIVIRKMPAVPRLEVYYPAQLLFLLVKRLFGPTRINRKHIECLRLHSEVKEWKVVHRHASLLRSSPRLSCVHVPPSSISVSAPSVFWLSLIGPAVDVRTSLYLR